MCARRRNSTPRRLRRRDQSRRHARDSVQTSQNNVNGFPRAWTLPGFHNQQDKFSGNSSPCEAKLSEGSPTALRAPRTSASAKRVEEIALLFVVNDDVIHILPLRVLALECRGPRFSGFRDHRRHGHHNLVTFLYGGTGRAVVERSEEHTSE